MTNSELYEIVKNHQDVWGQHFHTVRRGDESTIFVRHYANAEGEPAHREMELLGLGVEWLLERSKSEVVTHMVSHFFDRYITRAGCMNSTWQPSLLAAVYAAIAEVKAKA